MEDNKIFKQVHGLLFRPGATTHMKKHNAFLLTADPLMIFSLLTENMEKEDNPATKM